MGEMGVPAVFFYIAPWTGGVYTTGDSRITNVIQDVLEKNLKVFQTQQQIQDRQSQDCAFQSCKLNWMSSTAHTTINIGGYCE